MESKKHAINSVNEVSASSPMYKLKPYVDSSLPIQLPNCMYKMDHMYQQKAAKADASNIANQEISVVDELERRQENILSRLEKLRIEVEKLAGENKKQTIAVVSKTGAAPSPSAARSQVRPTPVSDLRATSVHVTGSEVSGHGIEDLVINADPSSPPLSLFVLQQLLSQQFRVLPSSYVHSSAKNIKPKLKDVFRSNESICSNRNAFQIGFTVVWKNEKFTPSLMVRPNLQTPIVGEGNIARYLARLIQPSYDSGDNVTATRIDELIDMASGLIRGDNSQKSNLLKVVSAQLGKSQWMVGDNRSLADIVLWSALHQSKQASKAPDNIKRWLDICGNLPEFETARRLL